eukprot:1848656-Amphidinium_carterae.2
MRSSRIPPDRDYSRRSLHGPWWAIMERFETTGGVTREMIYNRKNWENMEAGVMEPGYTTIKLPMMYEPNPMKARHVAHETRKEALIQVINSMGMDAFVFAIDGQIKSGEAIDWDDPAREAIHPPAEVDFDTKLNHY